MSWDVENYRNMKIILGSQSKGRKKVLEEMGYKFEVMLSNIDEKSIRLSDPKKLTLAIARAKAEALKSKISESAILITSDTVVVWNGKIREKPQDKKEAREFLESLHLFPSEVVTAVVVTNLGTKKLAEGLDIAKVYFYQFSEREIEDLLKEGSVLNLAGAFTVYGEVWEAHIKRTDGTIDSLMGLPKKLTESLISSVI